MSTWICVPVRYASGNQADMFILWICAQYLSEQPREPMGSHDIPFRPWSKVSADLFQLNGSNFLLLVDHYSDYFELEPLRNTLATIVIWAMKRNFAWYGIPHECITDNSTQFVSHENSRFTRDYGFTSTKSSPYHSQGNGKAESAVKIAKNILKKSRNEDPHLALLAYRNTRQQGYNYSPAERLMSRKLQDIIPTATSQLVLKLACPRVVQENIAERRNRLKVQYDKKALTCLESSQKGKKCISNPAPQTGLNHRSMGR